MRYDLVKHYSHEGDMILLSVGDFVRPDEILLNGRKHVKRDSSFGLKRLMSRQ